MRSALVISPAANVPRQGLSSASGGATDENGGGLARGGS